MNLKDAVDFEYPENEMAKPLKNITLSEADSTETFKFKPFEYERGAVTKTTKGVINTIRDMQDLPEQVKIFLSKSKSLVKGSVLALVVILVILKKKQSAKNLT